MKLRELLVTARAMRGLSQRELAARCGVSNVVIAQIENGRICEPSFAKIVAIADALDIPVERFASTVRK